MRRFASAIFFVCALFVGHGAAFAAASDADVAKLVKDAVPVALPPDIIWETNNEDPLIGSEKALRGGRLTVSMGSYPLTLRLMGPNNNDAFANWNQQFTSGFGLVSRHPNTDHFIPMMATHWSVQADQQTIYFKLDKDARFSDGHPITADDYVFTWRMMQSKFIVDPFYNSYAEQYLRSVDKIDDYTLRIVGTRRSWRPLADYAGLWPTPRHATVLDDTWVDRTTNQPQIAPGPYVISDMVRGESITFKRVPNWWGDKKRYFIGQYNFDEIQIRIIQQDRELDYLRRGELDLMQEASARNWAEGYNFPAIQNGWIRRTRAFVDQPSGVSGFIMNLEAPIFQNRDFRIAMAHLFNFDRLNRNVMFNAYFRKRSFFDGTEFANPNVKPYEFDPAKAREHLALAGYRRPSDIGGHGFWANVRNAARGLIFARSDSDDVLVNEKGEPARFTVNYSAKSLERHLTVIQQDFRRAGIDMRLQLLEPGTSFQRSLERKFEMVFQGMTSGLYPSPRQYLHSEYKKERNNNNFWGFGTQEVDDLIKTYEESMDADARRDALWRVDQIVHDEGIYIPFWDAPFQRLVYWDYLQFPESFLPRRTEAYMYWMVYWIDPAKRKALEEAMRDNRALPAKDVDVDYFHVRDKLQ